MSIGTIGPGDDVEAWCTRCKMNLEHRVIACVGKEIKRVHCLTCGSDHKYYPPRSEGSSAGVAKAVRGTRTAGSKKAKSGRSRAYGEWARLMEEMPEGTVPKTYRITDEYKPADYLEHPMFGTGRVLGILGSEKIEVAFKEGRKVLICNRKNS